MLPHLALATIAAMRTDRRLVIFDFDGTLADTWRDIATPLNQTLRDAGLPDPPLIGRA